jgi:hypothetical protein
MGNSVIYNRLAKCGLRGAAESLKEEIRMRRKSIGDKRDLAVKIAEDEMWNVFRPIVEKLEKQKQDDEGNQLTGCTDDLDEFLDPDYKETDPGKRLRDGLLWTAEEIRRVVTDTTDGTTVDLSRAATPPPTAWAVFCLESFARKSPEKRAELISRVLPFATRSHDPSDSETADEGSGGLLDTL